MIQFTAEQIEKAQEALKFVPEKLPGVLSRAINRAAESARTEAGRKAREQYYIKQRDVVSTIRIRQATPDDLAAIVISRGNLVPLTKFRVTPNRPQPTRKSPIIVRVKKGGGGPIKHAFVARMRSGHLGVFNRAGKKRLPIMERYGPSVPEMLNSDTVSQYVEAKASEVLEKRLEHEIERVLGG